jgi:hypothetical protein
MGIAICFNGITYMVCIKVVKKYIIELFNIVD